MPQEQISKQLKEALEKELLKMGVDTGMQSSPEQIGQAAQRVKNKDPEKFSPLHVKDVLIFKLCA